MFKKKILDFIALVNQSTINVVSSRKKSMHILWKYLYIKYSGRGFNGVPVMERVVREIY
jgi:hypothetical protein